MGCSSSCIRHITMSFFSDNSNANNNQSIIERKLYLAKENPEPVFDLSSCELYQIPPGVFTICKVYRKEFLYFNNNNLSTLNHGGKFQDLQLIKVLNISYNNFTVIPDDISHLVNITELYLQNNCIKTLPSSFQYLKCLLILDISNNCLGNELTPLSELTNLQVLNLKGNKCITRLCPELCHCSQLKTIELDIDNYVFPPPEVICFGTEQIMKYLCQTINVEYREPSSIDVQKENVYSITSSDKFNKNKYSWEQLEANNKHLENKYYEAAKAQKDKFLAQVLQDQCELDSEIAKIQVSKEGDRQRLFHYIQEETTEIQKIVDNYVQSSNLKPEVLKQQLLHDQLEQTRLLEIVRQNFDNMKKTEVLKAMESMLNEICSLYYDKKNKEDYWKNQKENILLQELMNSNKLDKIMKEKDQSKRSFLAQLLEDQNVQKAVVTSLVEKVDAKSWSLNEEISLISSHLAKLSIMEQEKKKLQMNYNFNELLTQRSHLLNLLDDLLMQQQKRRKQLIETMKQVEMETNNASDFWLKNYQKVIESAPKSLLTAGQHLDPLFANCLLQEGVIHCLPFLVAFLFSNISLNKITTDMLKKAGVSLQSDINGIKKAIHSYILALSNTKLSDEPSAPELSQINEVGLTGIVNKEDSGYVNSECVICLDSKCEVAFVPCGHLCCCVLCSNNDMKCCPMCRTTIERKIKIIVP